jgi:hypothetical protein
METVQGINDQSWPFDTFSSIRYLLCYRYSATFRNISIRYSLLAIATFVDSREHNFEGLYCRATDLEPDPEPYLELDPELDPEPVPELD